MLQVKRKIGTASSVENITRFYCMDPVYQELRQRGAVYMRRGFGVTRCWFQALDCNMYTGSFDLSLWKLTWDSSFDICKCVVSF